MTLLGWPQNRRQQRWAAKLRQVLMSLRPRHTMGVRYKAEVQVKTSGLQANSDMHRPARSLAVKQSKMQSPKKYGAHKR